MLPGNFNEPMGVPGIFEKQIGIKLFHSEVTDSGEFYRGISTREPDPKFHDGHLNGSPVLVAAIFSLATRIQFCWSDSCSFLYVSPESVTS
ncbi:MAG: hypothetical protein P8X79_02660 [Reinekea sp.]